MGKVHRSDGQEPATPAMKSKRSAPRIEERAARGNKQDGLR